MSPKKGDSDYIGNLPYAGYKEAKPHIFERDGYVCQNPECGKTLEEFSKESFVIHHINGDKRDQRWCNLEVLCRSCNSLEEYRRETRTRDISKISEGIIKVPMDFKGRFVIPESIREDLGLEIPGWVIIEKHPTRGELKLSIRRHEK